MGADGALPPGITEDALSQVVAITCKPRDQCILALVLSRGSPDMACSLLFEGVDLNQIAAQVAGGNASVANGAGAFGGPDEMMADYGDEAEVPNVGANPGGA